MALTDRITALAVAVAAAFNARVQAPASGYDVAVLNGYTGTQAQWLADVRGTRRYATLTAMVADLATASEGAVATVGRFALSAAYYHERSLWQKINGVWVPVIGTKMVVSLVDGNVVVGNVQTAAGLISTFVSANSSATSLFPGVVVATNVGSNTSAMPIELAWNGTSWLLYNALNVQSGWGSVGTSGATQTGLNELNVVNGMATWHYGLTRNPGMGADTAYWQMIPGYRGPTTAVHFAGHSSYQGGSRTACAMRFEGQGLLYITGNNSVNIDTILGTCEYRLAA